MNRERINVLCEQIEENPVFQMSLGEKELFHSNFLAWALSDGKHDGTSKKVMIRHFFSQDPFNLDADSIEEVKVKREKKNIDLTFRIRLKDETQVVFVFENKVKSLAYKEQLLKYREGFKNEETKREVKYFLLSLMPPSFELGDWKWIDYSMIAKMLNEAALASDVYLDKSSSFPFLLRDYVRFVRVIHQIGQEVLIKDKNYFAGDIKYDFSELTERFKFLRFHDVFQKIVFEQMALELKSISRFQELKSLGEKKEFLESNPGAVYLESGYSNKDGAMLDIKILIEKLKSGNLTSYYVIGIQLQGQNLKLSTEVWGAGSKSEKLNRSYDWALSLFRAKEWIDLPQLKEVISITKSKSSITKGRGTKDEMKLLWQKKKASESEDTLFCSFAPSMIYRYTSIDEGTSLSQLLEAMAILTEHVVSSQLEYKKAIAL